MESASFRLRVTYKKDGRLRFLSHLELVHAQERMVRRAGLPFAITQGFSPHMKLAFGPALSVGCGSDREYLEVWLTEYIDAKEALLRLKEASVEELMPFEAVYVAASEPSLVEEFVVSSYSARIDVTPLGEDARERLEAAIEALLAQGEIEVVRKKKTKIMRFEDCLILPPCIRKMDEGEAIVDFALVATDTGSLRPDLLIDALVHHTGIDLSRTSLMRTNLQSREQ